MEMTLTVHVPRRRPLPVDVVVEWAGEHCAADLCRELGDHLGESVQGLTSRGVPVEPDAIVGRPPLVHGASVAVTAAVTAAAAAPARAAGGAMPTHGLLELVVTGGPDAGRAHPLLPPGVSVGRAPAAGLALADDALSRVHATFDVGPAGVTVRDEGSTNGVVVDGTPIAGATPVDATSTIVVGSSSLRLRRVAGRGLPVAVSGDGTLLVRPPTGTPPDAGPLEIACPPPPPERHRVRIPWIAALVPVPIGVGLAFVLGPYLLVFALMGPLVLLASALGDRWGSGRAHRHALATHADDVEAARARLGLALANEAARLRQAHPDPHDVLTIAERVLPGLWAGGLDGAGIPLRAGTGAVPTRVAWIEGTRRTHPPVEGAPVVIDLARCQGLAVVGAPEVTDGQVRMLVGQLCTLLPAHRLALAVVAPDDSWGWAGLLPQRTDVADLLAPEVPSPGTTRHRVLVVPQVDAVVGGAIPLVTRALDAGVHVIVAATERSGVPSGVATVLVPGPDGRHVLETEAPATSSGTGTGSGAGAGSGVVSGTTVTLDLVGEWWADRVARALAPLRTSDGARGGLPQALSLTQVLTRAPDGPRLEPAEIASRWRARTVRPSTPAAVVGATADGPFSIDLVHDGPHVLVGGTTGSGKSEFLRTLVTSLALSCPPEELTFVLVDFKGGAAFGACAALPHVVGLVTDLDDHLVSRALRSLGAELRRRERIFAEAGASDLEGYRRSRPSGAESVPRLVVVIDELKALVDEVPDFVSGLVRLAALGRSLGVHLVLATQRPAGAVTAEIQANVNLRIAFRVRDRADSLDILEDPAAAGIRSSTPGRALCRGGDGALVTFQAATVSDGAPDHAPHLLLRRPGPSPLRPTSSDAVTGTDTVAPLVDAVSRAHHLLGGPEPRRPWLPPLPGLLRPEKASPAPAGDGTVSAVVGQVDEPELQRASPLVWTPGDGTWLLSGRPGSGRTTALRTLVLAVAGHLPPQRLHVHVIDPVGSLADLEHLPHVGTRIGPTHHRGLASLLSHLTAEIEARRSQTHTPERSPGTPSPTDSAPDPGPPPLVLVVIDGWDQLAESHGHLDADGAMDTLFTILRDGPSVGVVGIVSGGRTLLQPRWSGIGARTLLLGAVDSLDAALAGLRLADVPRDPPAGRAVRLLDRREIQFALTTPEDSASLDGPSASTRPGPDDGTAGPWTWRELPPLARRPHRPVPPGRRAGSNPGQSAPEPVVHQLDVGLVAPQGEVWGWRPAEAGRRLLVAGPPGSGRTNTLVMIAGSAVAAGLPVAVVLGSGVGVGGHPPRARFGGAEVISVGDVDALVTLRRRHPHLVVLVDDADRIGDDSPILPVLREVIDLVDRDRGLVAVATTASALAARFRGLDVEVARHRVGILLSPERAEGDLLGARLRETPPRMPGRGVTIIRGKATEVQVFLADDSG